MPIASKTPCSSHIIIPFFTYVFFESSSFSLLKYIPNSASSAAAGMMQPPIKASIRKTLHTLFSIAVSLYCPVIYRKSTRRVKGLIAVKPSQTKTLTLSPASTSIPAISILVCVVTSSSFTYDFLSIGSFSTLSS